MNPNDSAAATLEAHILEHIPLARAMQVRVPRYASDEVEMTAPLAPNINDKGCAFGGSMVSLLTLAGWGLIELGLRAEQLACDIYVGDTHIRYQEPAWGGLRGVARFTEPGALAALVASLQARGKGHADVQCEIRGDPRAAAILTARFFARLRKPAGDPAQSPAA
ncbi:MAG: YiiD C-terminal domain-containing protein [Proteobacteria bacterium]|nr:YiiD C-terminal domain-containing protein [Pseudomonadota bacterium]